MQTSEYSKIVDTLMSIPGMQEAVKIPLKVSRKQILLLTQIIEKGLQAENKEPGTLLASVGKEDIEGLRQLSNDLLDKSGLKDMRDKLNALQVK